MIIPIVFVIDDGFACIVDVYTLAIYIVLYLSLRSYRFCARSYTNQYFDRVGD